MPDQGPDDPDDPPQPGWPPPGDTEALEPDDVPNRPLTAADVPGLIPKIIG